MKNFKIGQPVRIIDDQRIGIVTGVDKSFGSVQVRIVKGQKGAGQILGVYSENVEEYELPPLEIHEVGGPEESETTDTLTESEDNRWRKVDLFQKFVLALGFVLIVGALVYGLHTKNEPKPIAPPPPPPPKQKTIIETKTEEIQALERANIGEFEVQKKVVGIFNDSKERVRKNDEAIARIRSDIYLLIGTVPWKNP